MTNNFINPVNEDAYENSVIELFEGKTTAPTAVPAWNVQKMTMDFVKTADSAETVQ